jgi:hypothetical protein
MRLAPLRGGRFYQLNQDLPSLYRGHKEKIHTRSVGPATRLWIDRLMGKSSAQGFCGSVYISREQFDLLDTFAESLQIARNRTSAAGLLRCQDVEAHAPARMQLEFFRILVWWDVRQPR